MIVTRYINKINPEKEQQFSATTVLLPDDTIFVSYRGTDSTIIGWKEDFNMCFKSHITSQKEAVQYLNESAEKWAEKAFEMLNESRKAVSTEKLRESYDISACAKRLNEILLS